MTVSHSVCSIVQSFNYSTIIHTTPRTLTHTHIHCRLPTTLKLPPIRYSPSQLPTDSMLQEENQTQPKPANPKQKPKQTPLMATRPNNNSRKRGESEISGGSGARLIHVAKHASESHTKPPNRPLRQHGRKQSD
jgi:hypothetical protein